MKPLSDAFGIFTQDASGCGVGAIQNVAPDGTVTLNSHYFSASPGAFISVYGTGFPTVYMPPPEGTPAGSNPLSLTPGGGARLGLAGFFQVYPLNKFSGLAPGLIGVNQMNFQIPDDAPEGCDIPLTISGHSSSQPVTLSIRKGGGACQNAALGQFASLHWQKTTTSGPDSTNPQVTESFTGTFLDAPNNLLAPPSASSRLQLLGIGPAPPPKSCPIPGIRSLNAGRLILTGVNGVQISSDPDTANTAPYAAALPPGSIQSGQVRISAVGGPDVGAFQSSLPVPAPIEIITPLPPGTAFSAQRPIRVSWKGGTADSLVRLQVDDVDGSGGETPFVVTVPASVGEAVVPTIGNPPLLPGLVPSNTVAISVTMMPAAGQASSFSAPGLPNGKLDWSYQYMFKGLKIVGL